MESFRIQNCLLFIIILLTGIILSAKDVESSRLRYDAEEGNYLSPYTDYYAGGRVPFPEEVSEDDYYPTDSLDERDYYAPGRLKFPGRKPPHIRGADADDYYATKPVDYYPREKWPFPEMVNGEYYYPTEEADYYPREKGPFPGREPPYTKRWPFPEYHYHRRDRVPFPEEIDEDDYYPGETNPFPEPTPYGEGKRCSKNRECGIGRFCICHSGRCKCDLTSRQRKRCSKNSECGISSHCFCRNGRCKCDLIGHPGGTRK